MYPTTASYDEKKREQKFLKIIKKEQLYDPAIPLLSCLLEHFSQESRNTINPTSLEEWIKKYAQ